MPRFARALSAYFADESQKLARKLAQRGVLNEDRVAKLRDLGDTIIEVKEAATAAEFDFEYLEWDAENRELRQILRKEYIDIGNTVYANTGAALGVELAFDLNARNSKEMLNAIGPLVKGINDESRDRLKSIVKTGIDNGDSPAQIAKTMLGSTQGWAGLEDLTKSRAMTIARTETAHAYTMSSISAYEDSGIIKTVVCLDSPDCGWRGHNDPELANGTERSFSEARLNPTSHPNCVRAFAPKVAGRTDQEPAGIRERKPKEDLYASPRTFESGSIRGEGNSEGERWADAFGKPAWEASNLAEVRAAQRYSGSGYRWMNDFLRNGTGGANIKPDFTDPLQSYIARAKVPEAVVVHRGVGSGKQFGFKPLEKPSEKLTTAESLIGRTFEDKGFMSTSIDPNQSFGGVKLELTVPKGYEALPISVKTTGAGSGEGEGNAGMAEAELLLQAGSKYVITGFRQENIGGGAGQVAITLLGRILPR